MSHYLAASVANIASMMPLFSIRQLSMRKRNDTIGLFLTMSGFTSTGYSLLRDSDLSNSTNSMITKIVGYASIVVDACYLWFLGERMLVSNHGVPVIAPFSFVMNVLFYSISHYYENIGFTQDIRRDEFYFKSRFTALNLSLVNALLIKDD